MKNIFLVIALALGLTANASIKSVTLKASGLTCSMCSKAIYTALSKISFVDSVRSDIKASSYKMTFKKDAVVNFDEIKKTVENAGFTVAALDIVADFSGEAIENDAHIQMDNKTLHFIDVKAQKLEGEQVLTLIDKNYIPSKVYKKYKAITGMSCYESGYMQSCCRTNRSGERIYHVTLKS